MSYFFSFMYKINIVVVEKYYKKNFAKGASLIGRKLWQSVEVQS